MNPNKPSERIAFIVAELISKNMNNFPTNFIMPSEMIRAFKLEAVIQYLDEQAEKPK